MKTANKRFYIIMSVIILATLTVIWGHSFMPAETSAKESGTIFAFLQPLLDFLFGEGMSTEHFIRKAGHFTEFMILGAELLMLMRGLVGVGVRAENAAKDLSDRKKSGREKGLYAIVNAWVAGTLCGLMDESIQLFSAGRSSEVADVWLDSAGCFTGVLIATLICGLIVRRKIRKTVKN